MELPKGFLLSTAEAAIKKPGRKDMALIYSEADAAVAGVFTTNKIKGAPVKLDIERIRSGRGRAIIANSGNANVCTGPQGMMDASEMAALCAGGLGISEELVYIASTGVIGSPLPMDRMRPAIKTLAANIGKSNLEDCARGIMTTDTFPKFGTKKIRLSGKEVRLAGVAKGSGMIHPNMATMLSFIMTDAAIDKNTLKKLLKASAEKSFNRVTVDGDTSTSDTLLIMANGLAKNVPLKEGTADYEKFRSALDSVTFELARMIARDGEGATKLIQVVVKGAKSEKDALKGAFAIAHSPLVKTAIYGNDSNWGRIMAAIGYAGIDVDESRVDIFLEKVKLVKKGRPNGKDEEANLVLRNRSEVTLTVNLNLGSSAERVLTCDLSENYVKINAEYRT